MEDGDGMEDLASDPDTSGMVIDKNGNPTYGPTHFYSSDLSPSNQKFILDRLHDHGSALKALRLAFDFNFEFSQLLVYMQDMTRLSHIRLDPKPFSGTVLYPTPSFWSSANNQVDIAYRYAQLMAVYCRSLQYIQIQFFAWQVMTPPHARPAVPLLPHADTMGDPMLRRLEDHEVLATIRFVFHDNTVPDDLEQWEVQGDTIETITGENDQESAEVRSGMNDTVAGEAD
ncbi:hypothetical protein IFR05_001610 [Cadophora sp. M221]|nr:hypothetical protein IFR05_001610 [Cadophora sp. M221]